MFSAQSALHSTMMVGGGEFGLQGPGFEFHRPPKYLIHDSIANGINRYVWFTSRTKQLKGS